MRTLPDLHAMPRVERDIENCLAFIARQPWGKAQDRRLDIKRGIRAVLRAPLANAVKVCRPQSGIRLRRHRVAQFVIIYAYLTPDDSFPNGAVSIRAIRHQRVKDVFLGVKEPAVCIYA